MPLSSNPYEQDEQEEHKVTVNILYVRFSGINNIPEGTISSASLGAIDVSLLLPNLPSRASTSSSTGAATLATAAGAAAPPAAAAGADPI